jgi:NRPS condensation-like uncharacterized protein
MLQWNDLHPYNAVHVIRVQEPLEVDRLKSLIAASLEAKGLTGLALNRRRQEFQYSGGAAATEIKVIEPAVSTPSPLAEEIRHQLNTPFPQTERINPFRFFVVPESDSFALGLVYFHAVADAESILILLKDIVTVYVRRETKELVKPVDRYPSRHDNLLRHHPRVLARKLASLPFGIRALRRASRPHYRNTGDFENRFKLFTLNLELLNHLVQAAKTLHVTLNDLFLALMMQAVSCLNPDRTRAARRKGISLGCVVNIRKDLELNHRHCFGLMLGFFVVHHEVPPGISLADLARDIGLQTLRIKQTRLYLGAAFELALGRLLFSLFSEERRKKLYQKHYPLWAGLSNMDINPIWIRSDPSPPTDYFRAVSTGPVTPLVLSITTVVSGANIGLTYRSTVFSDSDIEQIQGCFLDLHRHFTSRL